MKNVKYLASLLAVWPTDEFKTSCRIRLYIRKFYGKFMKIYFYIFVWSMMVNIYFTRKNTRKLIDTIMVMLALYTTIIKIHICKNKTSNLINYIYETEKKMLSSPQKREYKAVYNAHVRIHYFMNKLTIFLGFLVMTAYHTFPFLEEKFRDDVVSSVRILPLELWLPFDKNEHYKLAFFCISVGIFSTVNYIVCLDMFIVGMTIFSLGQIKILQKKLSNFTNIVTKTGVLINSLVAECVQDHRRIIMYVVGFFIMHIIYIFRRHVRKSKIASIPTKFN